MAVKTYRVGVGNDGNFGALFEADQTAANRTDGWVSAKLAAANMSTFDAGTKKASGTFSTGTQPTGLGTGTAANAFKTPAPLTGVYAAGNWTFTFAMRCTVASAQRGRVRMMVFKDSDPLGGAGDKLVANMTIGTTVAAALSTTADQTSVLTFNPGEVTLDNEYLFFVIAWEITTAGGSNSADVVFRTGQSAAGSRLVTPDFAVPTPIAIGKVDVASMLAQTTQTSVGGIAGATGTYAVGDSFVATTNKLSQASLWLAKTGSPTDNLVVEICADAAGKPGAVVGEVTTLSGTTLTGSYVQKTWPCDIPLTDGATYWITARRTGAIDAANIYQFRIGNTAPAYSFFWHMNDVGVWHQTHTGGQSLTRKLEFGTLVRGISIVRTSFAVGKVGGAAISVGPAYASAPGQSGTNTAWTSIDNAATADASYASVSLGIGGSSNNLLFYNLGLTIPDGATVTDVKVEVFCFATIADVTTIVYLTSLGGSVPQNFTTPASPPPVPTVLTGLWGVPTWTKTDVENLFVEVQASTLNAANVLVDYLRVTVSYLPVDAGGTVVRGVTLEEQLAVPLVIGKVASATTIRGVALSPAPVYEIPIDDFNRADGAVYAGAGASIWRNHNLATTSPTPGIVSGNRLAGTGGGWVVSVPGLDNNCDLVWEITTPTTSGGANFGLAFGALDKPQYSGVTFGYDPGSNAWWGTYYTAGGSGASLGARGGVSVQAGDTYWMKKAGSNFTLYKKLSGAASFVLIGSWAVGFTTGAFGLYVDTVQRIDNVRGGPFVILAPIGKRVAATTVRGVNVIEQPPSLVPIGRVSGSGPAALPDCKLGLETKNLPVGAITTVDDLSPENNDLIIQSGSPTASVGYATFTTANVMKTTNVLPIAGNDPRHLFVRLRARYVNGSFMGHGTVGVGTLFDLWYRAGNKLLLHGYGAYGMSDPVSPVMSPDVWHTAEIYFDPATLYCRAIIDNGTPGEYLQPGAWSTQSTRMTFGVGGYSPAGDFDMAACYFFERVLVGAERQQVLNYLSSGVTPGTSVVRGVTFELLPQTQSIGKRAAATAVRGLTLSGTGDVVQVIGKRVSQMTVRGATLVATGTIGITIGKKAAATTARGITLAAVGVAPLPIGKKLSATVTRGITVVPAGAAPVLVGKRLSATTVRGTTMVVVGAAPIVLGARASATTTRGVTFVGQAAIVPIGTVSGAAAPTLPVSTGLIIHLDASQLGLADGAEITTWPSLASPSFVGTNFNTSPNRPTLRANALSGKPVARFIASSGLRWSGFGLSGEAGLNWSCIFISRMWGTTPGRVVSAGYPPTNIALGYHGGYEDKAYVESFLLPDMSRLQTTNWHLHTITQEGVIGSTQAWLYSDGVFLSGGHAVTGGWGGSSFHLNGYNATGGEETCECEIAEVVMFDRRLSDVERQSVEGYLRDKWITGIGGAGGTTVRGISLVAGAAPPSTVPIGVRAATTNVRGIPVVPVGVVPITVGRRASTTTVRGTTVVPAPAAVPVGRRVAATSVKGVTLVPAGISITVGRRVSSTVVKGITLTGVGIAPIPIGKRAATTVARGIGLVPSGVSPVIVGRRSAVTTVTGLTVVAQGAPLPIGKVGGATVSVLPVTTGLAIQLDASTLGLADGADVTVWPDLSGQGRNFTAISGKPTYKTSGQNGLGVVRFVENTQRTLLSPTSVSYKQFLVVTFYTGALFSTYNGLVGGPTGNDLILVGTGGQNFWYNHWAGNTTYHMNGVLTPLNHTGPMSGVMKILSMAKNDIPWTMQLQIGQDRVETRYWDGDIAEIIAYDRVLSDVERQSVENYLNTKWFVPPVAAGTSTVRGVTTTVGGVAPIVVGKRLAATAVRGTTLVPGPVTVTLGKRVAATTVRGVVAAPAPVVVPIGRRAASTAVRGLSLAPGVLTVPIGRRAGATTVRGATLIATGVAFVPIGKRHVAAVINGIVLVPGIAVLPVGIVLTATVVNGMVIIEQSTLISDRKLIPGKIIHSHRGRTGITQVKNNG